MNIGESTNLGKIDISIKAVADIVGNTATKVYGVLGLINKKNFRNPLKGILSAENYSDGVAVHKLKNGYEVSLYLYVSKEVKISEVASEVQKQVSYYLNKTFGINVPVINVYILAIK